MSPPTNNWQLSRLEHHFYAEIITDITTRRKKFRTKRHIIGQHKKNKKMSNTDPTKQRG